MLHCHSFHIQVDYGVYDLKGNQTAPQGYCQCPHSPFGLRLDCHTGTWYGPPAHANHCQHTWRLSTFLPPPWSVSVPRRRSDFLSLVSVVAILVHMWFLSTSLRALDRGRPQPHDSQIQSTVLRMAIAVKNTPWPWGMFPQFLG